MASCACSPPSPAPARCRPPRASGTRSVWWPASAGGWGASATRPARSSCGTATPNSLPWPSLSNCGMNSDDLQVQPARSGAWAALAIDGGFRTGWRTCDRGPATGSVVAACAAPDPDCPGSRTLRRRHIALIFEGLAADRLDRPQLASPSPGADVALPLVVRAGDDIIARLPVVLEWQVFQRPFSKRASMSRSRPGSLPGEPSS